jgi:hypothetical protein
VRHAEKPTLSKTSGAEERYVTNGDVSIYVQRARTLLAQLERCKSFRELNFFLGGVLEGREDAAGNERSEAAMYSLFLNGALCALLSAKLDQQHLNEVVARITECVLSDLQAWDVPAETGPRRATGVARSEQRWFIDRPLRAALPAGGSHSENDGPVSQTHRQRSLAFGIQSIRRDDFP